MIKFLTCKHWVDLNKLQNTYLSIYTALSDYVKRVKYTR